MAVCITPAILDLDHSDVKYVWNDSGICSNDLTFTFIVSDRAFLITGTLTDAKTAVYNHVFNFDQTTERDEYALSGWNVVIDGSGQYITSNEVWIIESDTTLYAVFTLATYSIDYNI